MLDKARLGRFTASGIWQLFVEGKGVTRENYIFEKAEEIVKGHAKSFSNKHTDHGLMNEYEAITSFKEVTGFNVEYLDQKYFAINEDCGATPDAHVVGFDDKRLASCDVKCPTEQFFKQKMLVIRESKPEFQNSPKQMFYQAQTQMLALGVEEHYLVRYLTKMDMDWEGNKVEYDLPLTTRLFFKHLKADKLVQEQILEKVCVAAKERDLLVEIFLNPIL